MFDVDIIASASAREGAKNCAWLDLGEVVVVGRSSPTSVDTIAGNEVFARAPEFRAWKALHGLVLIAGGAGPVSFQADPAAVAVALQRRDLAGPIHAAFGQRQPFRFVVVDAAILGVNVDDASGQNLRVAFGEGLRPATGHWRDRRPL